MSRILELLVGGLCLSGVYFLIGAGVTVIFGQTRVINFAHGQFMIIAALLSWRLTTGGLSFWLAAVVSILAVSLLALLAERLLLRHMRERPLTAFIVSLGLLIILTQATVDIFGTETRQLRSPISGTWIISGASIVRSNVAALGFIVLLGIALSWLFTRTGFGRDGRAASENPMVAEHVGVQVNRVASATFVLGSALAAIAGCVLATLYPISPYDGGTFVIKGFAVALVGGLGSMYGAAVAATLLGCLEVFGQSYTDGSWVPALTSAAIILTLLLRPTGILGKGLPVTQAAPPPPGARSEARWRPWGLALGFAAAMGFLAVPMVGFSYSTQSLLNFSLVYGLLAVGVGMLFRLTGILSFGHGAFFGLGGYFSIYSGEHWGLSFWPQLLGSVVVGVAFGAVLGYPLFRVRGLAFLIITFTVADFFALVENNWKSVTHGSEGMTTLESPSSIGGVTFETINDLWYLWLVILALFIVGVALIERTAWAERVRAIRDNETLARSLGVHVKSHLVVAFALSAGIASAAGTLFLYQGYSVAPNLFGALATITIPLMVIVGGGRSPVGPVIGALVLTLAPNVFSFSPEANQYFYGTLLIVVMLAMPHGVMPMVWKAGRWGRDVVAPHVQGSPRAASPVGASSAD